MNPDKPSPPDRRKVVTGWANFHLPQIYDDGRVESASAIIFGSREAAEAAFHYWPPVHVEIREIE